ncbi:hypothetical protein [Methanohalophilus portucalensis]|uniref:Uncharacterized protein n=2 Tax=Methanohalophilus portucalensis TaxID=39664 RepID=A0A1L9C4V3_9EURY|nr:hypothetical protein [Methanohalophilus portucalensis]ATU08207.1 hypothetical protein BKM01_05150 [Methanohalophilus portucalensis]OJH49511.1 hypothetical protein MPF_0299 [Methanohalophilus portucalensis FDF-1]RNI13627.1 hypothetical protein EFE41_03375 [Methanohalophilus portucalensis FDF-1]SMH35667.1 hypothetical protein SAMN06264941_1033 [Methanohalophilus portucalensis FDF-1]
MIKKIIAGIFVLFILLLFMGGDDGSESSPGIDIDDWGPVADSTSSEYRGQSMKIYETLAFSGFEKASVEVTDNYVFMAYDQPPVRSQVDSLLSWFYMMGTAAELAPHTEKIVIHMYSDEEPLYEVEAYTTDVQSLLNYEIDMDEFRSKVVVKSIV